MKREILKAVNYGNLYDFVSENYWKIDKDELVRLLKETCYAIDTVGNADIYEEIYENLSDFWAEELEDEEEEDNL